MGGTSTTAQCHVDFRIDQRRFPRDVDFVHQIRKKDASLDC